MPRRTGIKDLQTYMDGVNLYLEDTDVTDLYLNGLEGSESYETARDTIRTSIDEEIPVRRGSRYSLTDIANRE